MPISRWAPAALSLALLYPGSAHAATKVLFLPYQCLGKGVPTDLAEQATVVITKEMSQGGLTIIQADDVAEAAQSKPSNARRSQDAPTGDPGAGHKAEELIARAKEAVEESEFLTAIKELKNAVRLLEENGDAVADLRLLPEAYLQLGVAYFRNGNEDEGDDMLNKVVHLDPERQLDPQDYPPIFIRTFDRARFNVLRRPRANIEVKAAKGAQILYDGRNMGKAPLVLKEALPGNHWVRVERPGEPVQVKKISVKAQRTIVVEFEGGQSAGGAGGSDSGGAPVGVLGAIAANDITRDHVAQLKGAGARVGADFVMIGGIYKTDTAYMIRTAYVSVKDGSVGRLADIAFDLDMLSAEIEVYKLAEDAKSQATSGKLTNIVKEDRFAIAPSFKVKAGGSDRKPTKGEDTKVAMVVAAPPAPPPPEAPTIPEPQVAEGSKGAGGKGKGAAGQASSSGGRAPLASAEEKKEHPGDVEKKPAPATIPKDEQSDDALAAKSKPASSDGSSAAVATADPLTVGAAVPKDERNDGPSTWWIWVLVGVAAAGAAAAGGYFVLNGQSPTSGNLKVTWQ